MKKPTYTFLWNDYQPHVTIEGNLLAMQKLRSIEWNQVNNIIQVSWDNMIYCYHSTKDLKNDMERGKLFFNKAFVKKIFKEIDKNYKKQWEIFNILSKSNFKKYPNKKLSSLFHNSIIHWGVMISYFRMTQAEGTHYLVEKLKKSFSDEEEATILMTPTELDLANKEMFDWYKILKKPFSKDAIIKHVEKYPWVVISHFSYEYVIETLSQRYKYDKEHPQKYDFVNEKKKIKEKQERLLKTHPELKDTVKLIQKLAIYRMKVKSCWGGLDFYLIHLIDEIASRTGENAVDIHKYYLIDDIYQLLHNKKLSEKEKENRKRCFVGLWKNRKALYVSGEKAEKLAEKELKELYRIKKIKELKGTIAHPGIIKGKARILPTNNIEVTRHLRKTFQKGEILITGMTQPNIMDIASKAGAIVTDEGGMLSHAAIISREFKIPCIVGTHFATQVFNEGGIVEVDANKGIVRKINK